MTETVGLGNSPQTTNPTHSTGGGGLSWIKINTQYFMTLPGIIKLVQIILGIICMAAGYLHTVWISLFTISIIWSVVYLLGVREGLSWPINWMLTELIQTGFAAILYCVSLIIQLAFLNVVSAFFVVLHLLAYAVGTYLLYVEYRERGSGLEASRVPPMQVISI